MWIFSHSNNAISVWQCPNGFGNECTSRHYYDLKRGVLASEITTNSLQNKIWNLPHRSTILPKFIYDKEGKLARPTQILPVRVRGLALILKTAPTLLFVQHFAEVNNKENKFYITSPFRLDDSSHNGPVMQKMFPCRCFSCRWVSARKA